LIKILAKFLKNFLGPSTQMLRLFFKRDHAHFSKYLDNQAENTPDYLY
jgi:hypothetical protein